MIRLIIKIKEDKNGIFIDMDQDHIGEQTADEALVKARLLFGIRRTLREMDIEGAGPTEIISDAAKG